MDLYLAGLRTEQVNKATVQIDECTTLDALKIVNSEDKKVAEAVEQALPQLAEAVDMVYLSMKEGGRLIYIGAGTSGRLGVLDASECPPTFGTVPDLVQAYIAGGDSALRNATENCEDNEEMGREQILACGVQEKDVVVGITASGSAPYVIGALKQAKEANAKTIGVVNNRNTKLEQYTDICIEADTGPEVIVGSTRMKAGTAQKMILNMITTITMVKLGKVYGNMMVDLNATNKKLMQRAVRIFSQVTGRNEATAVEFLTASNYNTKAAILMCLSCMSFQQAQECLKGNDGYLKKALKNLADRKGD